jgi:hypothetical protein
MPKSVVRCDVRGLLIITGGYKFRPGDIPGLAHVYRQDQHTLKVGEWVKARHLGGTQLAKIVCEDGTVLHWANESAHLDTPLIFDNIEDSQELCQICNYPLREHWKRRPCLQRPRCQHVGCVCPRCCDCGAQGRST